MLRFPRLETALVLVLCCLCAFQLAGAKKPTPKPKGDPFRPLSAAEKYQKTDPKVIQVYSEDKNTTRVFVNAFQVSIDHDPNPQLNGMGVTTLPGNRIVFEVPPAFKRAKALDKIVLFHRKDNASKPLMKSVRKIPDGTGRKGGVYWWDFEPCFHTISCRRTGTNDWVPWRGNHGFRKRAEPRFYNDPVMDDRRFCEPRAKGDPDFDVLPDVSRNMDRDLACDLIMVENVAQSPNGEGRVHGIRVEYRPFRAPLDRKLDQIAIFTNGTAFAEIDWDALVPHYGGGKDQTVDEVKQFKGVYPGAKPMKAGEHINEHLNPWITLNNGGVIIRLRAGKLWAGCEIAIGDRYINPNISVEAQVDLDGQVGISGQAKGFAYLMSRWDYHKSYLMSNMPVGPATILNMGPATWDDINVPPSETENPFYSSFVRLDTTRAIAYMMGIRCRYYQDESLFFRPLPPRPENITAIASLAAGIKPPPQNQTTVLLVKAGAKVKGKGKGNKANKATEAKAAAGATATPQPTPAPTKLF